MNLLINLAINANNGDKNAFNNLYEEYKNFIKYKANEVVKAKMPAMDMEEAISIRSESFTKFIKKTDKNKLEQMTDKQLTIFIGKRIEWDMIELKSKISNSLIKFDSKMVKKAWQIKKVTEQHEKETGQIINKKDITDKLRITEKELSKIKIIFEMDKDYKNIDEFEYLKNNNSNDYIQVENKILISQLAKCLDIKEKIVLKEHYFKGNTDKVIAEKIGYTASGIRVIRARAERKMLKEFKYGGKIESTRDSFYGKSKENI